MNIVGWCVLFIVIYISLDESLRRLMKKIYRNNIIILKKLDIPGYPIYSYLKFIKDQKWKKK